MPASILFFISFIIRAVFIPLSGFKADIAYWKWWGMSAAHDGLSGPLLYTAYNYPSFYLYILKATSHLYEFFSGYNYKLNPQDAVFWNDQNLLYLFLIKTPYILADLGVGFLIYKIVKRILSLTGDNRQSCSQIFDFFKNFDKTRLAGPASTKTGERATGPAFAKSDLASASTKISADKSAGKPALIAAALYLLNPVVIYNSGYWGQTDSIGSFFVLLAFYGLIANNYWLIAVFSAIALFMKTQTLVFLPILFLIWFLLRQKQYKDGFSSLIKAVWVFIGTVIVINFPFLATKTMDKVFDIMYTSQLYFPYVSMNAYNLWWIFFGKASSSFWDQNLIANLITFKTMGVLLFGSVYLFAISLIVKVFSGINIKQDNKKSSIIQTTNYQIPYDHLLLAFVLVSFGFFLLLTQMHERYLFPVFVFFPILIGLYLPQFNKLKKVNWISIFKELLIRRNFTILTTIYFILSTTTIVNLHQVMIMNYPDNTLLFLPNAFSETLTRIVAIINVLLFIILLIYSAKKLPLKINLSILLLVVGLLFLVIIPRFLSAGSSVVSLTKLKPISVEQGYGKLQVNKNLSNTWLSSIYYFFLHGLATHAKSRLVYHINGDYKSFATNFGIDTDASTNASVHFLIYGDGKLLFKSAKMDRLTNPGYTKIDVTGIDKMELVVDDAGDGINSDHADWLEPILYK